MGKVNFASSWFADRHNLNGQVKYYDIAATENSINGCMLSVVLVRIMPSQSTSFCTCLPKE